MQILAEVFIQVLFEFGIRSLLEPFRRESSPVLAFFGYAMLGAIVGGISLHLIKEPFIKNHTLRLLNLMITPVLAGLIMAKFGRLKEKKGMDIIRLDKFGYGFIFAFTMTLTRFISLN